MVDKEENGVDTPGLFTKSFKINKWIRVFIHLYHAKTLSNNSLIKANIQPFKRDQVKTYDTNEAKLKTASLWEYVTKLSLKAISKYSAIQL